MVGQGTAIAAPGADTLKGPLIISVLAHVLLVSLFVFSFGQKANLNAPPTVMAIQARPVDERLLQKVLPRIDEQVRIQEENQRRMAQEQAAAEAEREAQRVGEAQATAAREREAAVVAEQQRQARIAAEAEATARREREQADRIAAEKAAATARREREEAARIAAEKAAAERAAKEKAAREKAAQEKAAQEKAAKEKARREAALAEQRRVEAAERERQRQDQAIMMAAIEEEERRRAAEDSGLLDQYATMIRQRVERNWIRPAGAVKGLECEVRVRQIPGGDVVDVRMGRCNGDATVMRSIEAAVYKASPLPRPPDPSLFEKELIFRFAPED